jgi:uncharacterized protein (DUF1697 family)
MTTRHVALLRGINVGGRNRVPMDELREVCERLGWGEVRTLIQSGNVVFECPPAAVPELERTLEGAIRARFGLEVPVIVRAADDWSRYVRENPFSGLEDSESNRLLLGVAKHELRSTIAEDLAGRARDGERIARAGEALWIHFPGGSGRSALTPVLLDRLAGSPVTTRNWRTVRKIDARLHG